MEQDGLRDARFFEFLSEEERAEFLDASEPFVFEPGDILIEEGAEPSSLFILVSGAVTVSKKIPGGDERQLAEINADEERTVVGERGLLGHSGASATVRAKSKVEAIKIPREKFRAMIREGRPAAYKLAYRIARTLARRLTRLDEEVVGAIKEMENRRTDQETDLEAFRDKLITDWTI